jgi:hypothetical protein
LLTLAEEATGGLIQITECRKIAKAWRKAGYLAPTEKPPLGLVPENIWLMKTTGEIMERIEAIAAAMQRYKDAGKSIPVEWQEELIRLEKEAPAETAHEKARRLWEEWCKESCEDKLITNFSRARQIIEPLLATINKMHTEESRTYLEALALDLEKANAEIDRLKSEAWTDDDMWWAVNKVRQILRDSEGTWYPEEVTLFKDALAARRAAKAKE